MIIYLIRLVTIALVFFVAGCGGGTRGSGGQLYDGFVGDPSGKALPNTTVTFLASGDSAVSDAQGRFVIETQGLVGALDIALERDDFQATTTTAPVPADAKRVRLTLTVSSGQRPSVTSSVEVVERTRTGDDSDRRPGGSGRDDDDDDDDEEDDSRGDDDGARDDDDDDDDDDSDSDSDSDSEDDDRNDSGDDRGGSGRDDDRDDSRGDSGGNSGNDGSSGSGRDESEEEQRDGESRRAEGAISGLSDTTVTVAGVEFTLSSSSDFRDEDGNPTSFSSFARGQIVKARGTYQGGVLVLERLELDD